LKLFDTKKSLYDVFNENIKKQIKAEEAIKKPTTEQTLGKVSLKVFQDPRLIAKVDDQTKKKHVDDKILSNVPADRTILVINLDENILEKKYRKWFGVLGKIRRVFTGVHYRKSKNTGSEGAKTRTSTKVYFALIIFKSTKEIRPMFEIPDYLQSKLGAMYKDIGLKMNNEGREIYASKLVTKYGKNELAKSKSEFQKKMEEDGFQVVGGEVDTFQPPKEVNDEERLRARKKKKRELQMKDFYRFQVKNNAVRSALNLGDMDMADEADVLKATKRRLKEQFKLDVENFKNKKVKKDQNQEEEEDGEENGYEDDDGEYYDYDEEGDDGEEGYDVDEEDDA